MPPEAIRSTHVEYVIPALTRDQARRHLLDAAKASWLGIAIYLWMALSGLSIVYAGRSRIAGLTLFAASVVVLVVLLLPIGFWALAGLRLRPDLHCAVDITTDGLAGTIGRRAISYPWAKIASVSDSGTFFFFATRDWPHRSIWVPKAQLANPHELWSQIDGILVSKRGLLPRGIPTFIVNTAC